MYAFSGEALRRRRQSAQIRPERIAVEINRSVESIRSYESGRVDPPARVVARLAAALGCEPADLFTESAGTGDAA